MENSATMPAAMPEGKAKAKEHWLVEVVGGFTLASTMVSALAMWYLVVQFALPISS